MEDRDLIERVKSGESQCFAELVLRYERPVFQSVFAFLGNRQEAEDVTQDVFVTAFRKIASFEYRASFLTWLRRIAFNQCVDARRKSKSRRTTSVDFEIEPQRDSQVSSPDRVAQGNELIDRVRGAIDTLAEEQRTIILLRDIDGLDYSEIAGLLDIPVGTVRSRLHRARCELREVMEKRGLQNLLDGFGPLDSSGENLKHGEKSNG
ncbi:RNA polymerase sigma factor [Pirellulaceae bacterium SH467]